MEEIIKRLKNDLSFERTKRKSLQAELKQKENEIEELKKRLQTLDDSIITYELTENQLKKYNKYNQAIDKIKEKLNLVNEIYSSIHNYRINDLKSGVLTLSNEILQIINEVEE